MPTLQYVGARYVPVFYSNPDGSWDWESGVQYEPLTIVKYGENSYTSRSLVPATVGSPNLNPEYWAQTGNYNGFLQSLEDSIDALTESYIPVSSLEDIDVTKSNVAWYLSKDMAISSGITFSNVRNVSIISTGSVITVTSSTSFNIFSFNGCENVSVIGVTAKGNFSNSVLYNGAIAYFTNCQNIRSLNNSSYNMPYNTIAQNGTSGGVIQGNYDAASIPGTMGDSYAHSAILVYGCNDIVVAYNVIRGQHGDGTISIYGASLHCRVVGNIIDDNFFGNKTYNSQIITVDSGCSETEVIGNWLRGGYYGIDLKADCRNTLCCNNIISGCVVGIADRKGESGVADQSFGIVIKGNLVVLDGHDELASYTPQFGNSMAIGILSSLRYDCNISGNKVQYRDIPGKVVGIYVVGVTGSALDYTGIYQIKDNEINLQWSLGSEVGNANVDSYAVYYNIGNFVCISGNTFRASSVAGSTVIFIDTGTDNITAMANSFKLVGTNKTAFNISSTLHGIIANNMNLYDHTASGLPSLLSSTASNVQSTGNIGFA